MRRLSVAVGGHVGRAPPAGEQGISYGEIWCMYGKFDANVSRGYRKGEKGKNCKVLQRSVAQEDGVPGVGLPESLWVISGTGGPTVPSLTKSIALRL